MLQLFSIYIIKIYKRIYRNKRYLSTRHKFFSILFYHAKARDWNWSINITNSLFLSFKFHFNECQWHFFLFRNISLESIDFMSLLPTPLSILTFIPTPGQWHSILSPLEDRVHNFPILQPIPTPSESCQSVSRLLTLITHTSLHIYISSKLKIVFYLLQ